MKTINLVGPSLYYIRNDQERNGIIADIKANPELCEQSFYDTKMQTFSTIAHLAAYLGEDAILAAALEQNPGLRNTQVGDNTETPLHIAAGRGHISTTNLLLQKGSDEAIKTRPLLTAFGVALSARSFSENHLKVMKLLVERDRTQVNMLYNIPYPLLSPLGVSVFQVNESSFESHRISPLHYMIIQQEVSAVQWLLQEKADIFAYTPNCPGIFEKTATVIATNPSTTLLKNRLKEFYGEAKLSDDKNTRGMIAWELATYVYDQTRTEASKKILQEVMDATRKQQRLDAVARQRTATSEKSCVLI